MADAHLRFGRSRSLRSSKWPFRASDAALFSVECHDGNYAIVNFLRGARAEERRAQPVRR